MDSFRAVIVVVCRSQRNGALEVLPRQRPGEACAERRRRGTIMRRVGSPMIMKTASRRRGLMKTPSHQVQGHSQH